VKILVCGSRTWISEEPIRRILSKLPTGTVVVHGGANGADIITGKIAKELGLEVREYPVPQEEWNKVGKAAGVLRNERMLKSEHPDADGVIIDKAFAFSTDFENSRGTRDMVSRLWKVKIRTEILFPIKIIK
jgi:hypothetical protein